MKTVALTLLAVVACGLIHVAAGRAERPVEPAFRTLTAVAP